MIIFYTPNISEEGAVLQEDEYVHCCRVLRRKVGDTLIITDGKGKRATAQIKEISKQSALLSVSDIEITPHPSKHIILAVAPPKNRNRWEWLVEKTVEIGADRIIPIQTMHSERPRINHERTQKIVRSAALQSMRSHHPVLSELISLKKLIRDPDLAEMTKFIAHYNEQNTGLKPATIMNQQGLILIGPEGDFSEEERELCKQNNFTEVNLSHNRLRTETAAIVAVTKLIQI